VKKALALARSAGRLPAVLRYYWRRYRPSRSGAAVGGALGLGAGALIGDQLQGQEVKQADQQRQIDANQAELDRQQRELDRLKQQREY